MHIPCSFNEFNIYTVNSKIFARIFSFANSAKSQNCDVKYSRLGPDSPISVNDRMISPFREGYIFTKLHETLAKISKFTVICQQSKLQISVLCCLVISVNFLPGLEHLHHRVPNREYSQMSCTTSHWCESGVVQCDRSWQL